MSPRRSAGRAGCMDIEPVVVRQSERRWETWPEGSGRGPAAWKTLISAPATPTSELTLGVSRLPPGGTLPTHHHAQAEAYLVLGGRGVVTVKGVAHEVGPGDAVFIPSDAPHAVHNPAEEDLQVAYVLAADGFADVQYAFEAGD
jgi:quercetin dioxygenase-like cupin family protein